MLTNIKNKIVSIVLLLSLIIGSVPFISNANQKVNSDEEMKLKEVTWFMTPTNKDAIVANPNKDENAIDKWESIDNKKVLKSNSENIDSSIIHTPNLIRGNNSSNYWLDYQNLLTWINPTQSVNWNSKGNGNIEYFDWAFSGKAGTDEEWKIFRGNFNLSEEELSALKSEKAKLLIAVPGKTGPQMIYPLNDYASFFANENNLGINFMTYQGGSHEKLYMKLKDEYKTLNFKVANRLFVGLNQCKNEEHDNIMRQSGVGSGSRIDGWHVHLDNADESNTRNAMGEIPANYLKVGDNKLEILAGDNWTAGGVVKPEIYYYEGIPSINVEKRAYIKVGEKENTKKIYLDENDKVAPGQRVYFEFDMTNKSNTRTVTDLSFVDNELDINKTITKDGVYSGENKVSVSNIEVYNKNNPSKNLEFDGLSSLTQGETITLRCEDVLYYDTKASDRNKTLTNIVTGYAKYFNNQLESSDDASVKISVEDKVYKASIEKSIHKVNNKEVTEDEQKNIVLHPEDNVLFEISITNYSKGKLDIDNPDSETIDLPMVGLTLTDILKSNEYKKDEWEFKDEKGNTLDLSEFKLEAKETKKIYAQWIVPIEDSELIKMNQDIKNTATLSQYDKVIGNDSVDLKLGTWSINLQKVIDDIKFNEKNKYFTLNLRGVNNNSKVYTVAANPDKTYTIDNLKYGETYTADEIVPMNYKLLSIQIDNNNIQGSINHSYKDKTIVFKNKKVNDSWFFDEDRIENLFNIGIINKLQKK